jgi:hypothetical protein
MPAPKGNNFAKGHKPSNVGYGEKLNILRRYNDLTEPYFNFLHEKLTKGTEDEKWKAVDALKGSFTKMIPQDVNLDANLTMLDVLKKLNGDNGETTKEQDMEDGEPLQDNE